MTVVADAIPTDMLRECCQTDARDWSELMTKLSPKEGRPYTMLETQEERDILQDEYAKRLAACRNSTIMQPATSTPIVDAIKYVAGLHRQKFRSIDRVISKGEMKASKLRAEGEPSIALWQARDNDFRKAIRSLCIVRTNALDLTQLTLAEAQTGVDGKYVIEGLAPGTYCLHAELNLRSTFAEWAMPVHVVAGKPIQVDFSSSNALVVLGN